MSLAMSDDTNTTHIATTSHHGDRGGIELDEVGDLSGRQIDLDGIIDLDDWVRVSNTVFTSVLIVIIFSNQTLVQRLIDSSAFNLRASVMRDQEWDSSFA